ncbi:MAG: ribonuclease H-like domain-containing protein [Bryobacteraceae bacterium]
MSGPDTDAQIRALRETMLATARRVDRTMAARMPAPPPPSLEASVPGAEVETPHGKHYEALNAWDHRRRHGNMELGTLSELPHDLLEEISEGAVKGAPPASWAFLDTETTGLAGGSGTCAFLIGIGRITQRGFTVRQYFMRDFAEEASQLWAVAQALEDVEVLVTYNGKCFDVPLLETRYRMQRAMPPFQNIPHLDLLYGARRLWRLRLDSCKLTELEARILGHEREDDIPGELIPLAYFDFVRTGRVSRLAPVFLHNALDIVSLACLTGVVPGVFRKHSGGAPAWTELRHPAECVAMGRWLRQAGRPEEARNLFRRAVNRNLAEELIYRTLWDLADLERKLEDIAAAVAIWTQLASMRNPHQTDALIALAKHYEHRLRDYTRALECTDAALAIRMEPEFEHRRRRLAGRASQSLLIS